MLNTEKQAKTNIRTTQKVTTENEETAISPESPASVYKKKKAIFRLDQIVWYIFGVIDILLAFRFVLKMLGANPYVDFTSFIYGITTPFVAPFYGILGTPVIKSSVIEWSTLVAILVYLVIAWGIDYLLELIYPISPKDV